MEKKTIIVLVTKSEVILQLNSPFELDGFVDKDLGSFLLPAWLQVFSNIG